MICKQADILCVQPRVVHINAVSNVVENITFMYCPPGRQVSVPVPVQVCSSPKVLYLFACSTFCFHSVLHKSSMLSVFAMK